MFDSSGPEKDQLETIAVVLLLLCFCQLTVEEVEAELVAVRW